jgi:cobaltochelatase CobS
MRDSLLSLPKNTVLDLFKHLNGGSVGFDHERSKKTDCVDKLLNDFPPERIQSAMTACGVMMGSEQIPAQPPAPAPAAIPAATGNPADAMQALRALLGVQVDQAAIQRMVLTEVNAALAKSPVVKIEVVRPDGTEYKAEGHVRTEFQEVLTAAMCGLNILLVGPAGCGKTHLAHQVAEALGRSFASISCTAGMSESALMGWMLPSEGGAFDYTPSDFVTMYENGGVFLFDEIDAADPNTLLFVNQALANGSFYLPQRKGNSKVTRHPDFVCLAAANTFGTGANMTYAGRERLDEATLDRFRAGTVMLDYDTRFEKSVIDSDVLSWGHKVRSKIAESRLSRVMSTRFLLDATKLKKAGRTLQQIQDTYFVGWKADEKAKVA